MSFIWREPLHLWRRLRVSFAAALFFCVMFLSSTADAQSPGAASNPDALQAGFIDPPASARPRVWWHWLNGNITTDGIRKDMEWMKRVGVGGLQNVEASLATPRIVDKRLVYMSPDWKDAFHYAAEEAEHLDLELAVASSPGWSETGGPWVQPQDALKKLVWSETLVDGGRRFTGKLPSPPDVTGPFQTLRLNDPMAALASFSSHRATLTCYADVAVLAYPVARGSELPLPEITSNEGGKIDAAKLDGGDLATTVEVARGTAEQPNVLVLSYPTPQTVRAATLYLPGQSAASNLGLLPRLEASVVDGSWRKVVDIPIGTIPTTVSFAPVTARLFRVVFATAAPVAPGVSGAAPGAAGGETFANLAVPSKRPIKIAELRLSAEARVDRFEAKAGYSVERDYYALSSNVGPDVDGLSGTKVIDLTHRMKPDGTLDWKPPRGRWHVLRLGWSLVGTSNHPAPPEATGLEVDKFDGDAVRRYLETYLGMYRDTTGPSLMGGHGLRALLNDSIEVGAANWTPRMIERFKQLRGYDPTPWLPALTGVIMGSRSASDAFLYDYRHTLADLMTSQHYGTIAAVAHEQGLKVYGEALEDGRPSLGDDMAMRSHTDVPMGAMWTYPREAGPKPNFLADIKGAASVAHVYGQNLTAAESLTSMLAPWAYAPGDLRRIVDLEFATGVNLPAIHTSVHEPLDDKVPGLRLFVFGQDFNRLDTWAEMARPWIDYIARNSYLLQQGRYCADVAYFYGEEGPLTALYGEHPVSDAPRRYAYDFVNADALTHELRVQDGDLISTGGARYRVLYLGGSSQHMTLPVLRQIESFVEAGATVVGEAPQSSPSLADDNSSFDQLVHRLWSGQPVTNVGRGKVLATRDVESALSDLGVQPDVIFTQTRPDTEILFLHRRLADGDLYFINNRKSRPEHIEARFRVIWRVPEIWHADTGLVEPISYRIEDSGTVIPLDMEAEDSFFVVFRTPAQTASATVPKPALSTVETLEGPWDVSLQPKQGAVTKLKLETLASLSELPEPAVKYFSGVATYTKVFELPKGAHPGAPLVLDFGKVGDLAEVRVNGKPVGTAWHPPYRLEIGTAVKRGRNQLEIRVANLWVNRLIGDAQPGANKVTYTAMPAYRPDAPLRPSGLIGPVQLEALAIHHVD